MNVQAPIAIFDLGGVLIDWNPRYLYRKLFAGDESGMEQFYTHSQIKEQVGRDFRLI